MTPTLVVEWFVIHRGNIPSFIDVFATEAQAIEYRRQLLVGGITADVVRVTRHQGEDK